MSKYLLQHIPLYNYCLRKDNYKGEFGLFSAPFLQDTYFIWNNLRVENRVSMRRKQICIQIINYSATQYIIELVP